MIADHRAATCAVLVLAAGGSRRLGRPKQLVRRHGRALVVRALEAAVAVRPLWVGVVLGARAGRVAAELDSRAVTVVLNRRWRQGLALSLRAGLRKVPRSASHVLVMTVDQWQVTACDLAQLLKARARVPVAAAYADTVGVPAVFPRRYWRLLASLDGDRGARELLNAPSTLRVPLPRAAEDLDRPDDLARMRAMGG